MKRYGWIIGGAVLLVLTAMTIFCFGNRKKEEQQSLPAFSPLIFSKDPESENLADMLQESASGVMVKIFAGNVSGSGVILKTDGEVFSVVTAAHVLEQTQGTVWVTFWDGWAVECSSYWKAAEADAAFIQVPVKEIPSEHLETYLVANTDKKSFDGLQKGAGVIVMGSENGVAGNAYEGTLVDPWIYLEDFKQYMMLVNGTARQGMSGGGVFDQSGHFIGILCGGNEEGELAVLPLSVIEANLLGAKGAELFPGMAVAIRE